jgi:hypothetical protein
LFRALGVEFYWYIMTIVILSWATGPNRSCGYMHYRAVKRRNLEPSPITVCSCSFGIKADGVEISLLLLYLELWYQHWVEQRPDRVATFEPSKRTSVAG